MIFLDHPKLTPKYGLCAHLMSDIPGEKGTKELLAFVRRIGLKAYWIQNRGEPIEHFDVMRSKIRQAQDNGARYVTPKKLVSIIRSKKYHATSCR